MWKLVALLAALAVAACDGCPGDKPFTPYQLDGGGAASTRGSAAPASPPAASVGFTPVSAKPATEGGARWQLDGETIAPPAGRSFDVALELDVDGDGRKDLLAWVRSPDGSRGELSLWRGGRNDTPRVVAAPPADVLDAKGCTPRAALSQIGARTALIDVATECAAGATAKTARWLGVVQLDALTRLALELTLPRAPAGETWRVDLSSADVDADGRDDLTATLSVEGTPEPFPADAPGAERAVLRWLDRPQGLSPDPAEPTTSLASRAAALAAEARNKGRATAVRARARHLRRLADVACGGRGGASLSASTGPIACDRVTALGDVAYAEGLAALSLQDPIDAVAALAELSTLSPTPGPRQKDLDRRLSSAVPSVAPQSVRRLKSVPVAARASAPSPLAFEPGGALLVRTASGVVRAKEAGEEDAGMEAWPDALATSDGAFRLLRVEQRCDATVLEAALSGPGGEVEVPLPVLVPVAPSGFADVDCRRTEVAAVPLGAARDSIALAVGGALVSISLAGGTPSARLLSSPVLAEAPVPGSARAPDGSAVAIPTPRGVVVWSTAGAKLWTGDALSNARACVVAPGGTRLACVVDGAAVVFE